MFKPKKKKGSITLLSIENMNNILVSRQVICSLFLLVNAQHVVLIHYILNRMKLVYR